MRDPLRIDDGLPDDTVGWPTAVIEACAKFESGDVIQDPPLFYWADTRHPIWSATLDYVDESGEVPLGPELVDAREYAPEFGIITSQTCDIGEVDFIPRSRPWIMVAPVFDMQELSSGVLKAIRAGKHSAYLLHLPSLPADDGQVWVADLRIEVPVEKSVLAGRTPVRSFATDLEQRCVSERVAQLRSRPAWCDAVLSICKGLTTYLKDTRNRDRDLWNTVCAEIGEIGGRVDSLTNTTTLQLAAMSAGEVSHATRAWWDEFYTYAYAAHGVEIDLQVSVILDLNTCPVMIYRHFQPIPFRAFSL